MLFPSTAVSLVLCSVGFAISAAQSVHEVELQVSLQQSAPPRRGSLFKEGSDIVLQCRVTNTISKILDISWFKNGIRLIEQEVRRDGVFFSNNTLILQSVKKASTGNYTCKATNEQDTSTSNIVPLEVEYSPTCRESPQTVLVKEGLPMHLKCDVDARPSTDMRFTWYLNNTNGNREIVTNNDYVQVDTLTDENYGTYRCWATNNIGDQDKPCIFNVEKSNIVSELEKFLGLIETGYSWCDQYDDLATKAKENSIKVQELTNISQKVMPLLWKTWLDTVMWKDSVFEKNGLLQRIPVDTSVSRLHPLYELNTNLTSSNQFTIEIIMKMKKKANIGLRLMWVPEDGAPYSWDDDDILYSAHFRWVYPNRNWGKEKQVVFNTKENGIWGVNQAVFDEWPNFKIGQKFKLQITTHDTDTKKCFNMRLYMGHERFHLVPSKPPLEYVFCPSYVQQNQQRHLKLVLNEDIMYDLTDSFDIYQVMYMPKVLQFSPGQI